MTVLVTGAAGLVARQLLPGLEARYAVRLMDRTDDVDGAAPHVVGDLTDPTVLDRAVSGVDAIVHLAGIPEPTADWHELRDPNVEGFVRLLEAARRHRVRRVVFASSVHAMGAYDGSRRWPIDPAWAPAPCCAYGATKAFDEAMARVHAFRFGLSVLGLRLGLCASDPTPAEATAGWIGPADLRSLVTGALAADVDVGLYHGVSWVSRHRWDIGNAMTELGYAPERRPDRPAAGDSGHVATCGRPDRAAG